MRPTLSDLTSAAPEPIVGHIALVGDGAEIVGAGNENFGRLFEISEHGRLDLSDVVIRDFGGEEVTTEGLIFNAGELLIADVRIEHIATKIDITNTGVGFAGALIENHGS